MKTDGLIKYKATQESQQYNNNTSLFSKKRFYENKKRVVYLFKGKDKLEQRLFSIC